MSKSPPNRTTDDQPGSADREAKPFRRDLHWLMAIFVLAGIMRFGAAWQTQVISKDGFTWYITPAREAVEKGRWIGLVREDGMPRDHHPLYPAVLALMGSVVPEWDLAGQALGVVLGSLLIFPCYSFTKTVFGRHTALFASVIVAVMPRYCEYSGDVLSEPLSNLMMMSALAFGAKWARDYRWQQSALCGFFGGLAYLTRPEGLCFALAPIGWGLLLIGIGLIRSLQRRRGLRHAARHALTSLPALLVCFVLGFPYVLFLRHEVARLGGGRHWPPTLGHHLSVILQLKKEMPLGIAPDLKPRGPEEGGGAAQPALESQLGGSMNLAVVDDEVPHADRREFHWRLWMLLRRFGEANYPFIFLMFLGLLMIFWRPFALLPAWYVSAHFWGFFLLCLMFNYVSPYAMARRHFVALGCMAVPWIALGTETLWNVARRRQHNWFMGLVRVVSIALLITGLVLSFRFAWRPHRMEKVGLRRAGEWVLRAHGEPGARVLTLTDPRPAFYAQADPLRVAWEHRGDWDRPRKFSVLHAEMQRLKPGYLIVETDTVGRVVPDFVEGSQKHGLRPICVFDRSGLTDEEGNPFPAGEVWLFRLEGFWDSGDNDPAQAPEGGSRG